MTLTFSHSGFVVRDLAAATAFYRDVLGLTVVREGMLEGELAASITGLEGARVNIVFLGLPGERHTLELVQYLSRPGGDAHGRLNDAGAAHVCFATDDVDTGLAVLEFSDGDELILCRSRGEDAGRICGCHFSEEFINDREGRL